MFLIRTVFWLSLIVLLVPIGRGADDPAAPAPVQGDYASVAHGGFDAGYGPAMDGAPADDVSASAAFDAARNAVADLSGFCERNPATCETGSAALRAFGQKAQEGARLLYRFVAEGDQAAPRPDHGMRGTQQPVRSGMHFSTGDTLRPTDLDIPWGGPDLRG